jgi:eukaryotic-like serine/threonine-protein kinase
MDSRDAANRDLLVGLLALQNGLVDQNVLVAAFRTWTRDKCKPIAEILAAQGAIDEDERCLLDGLAAKHLKRSGGDSEKSLAAINAGPLIREKLASIGDPDIGATIGHASSGSIPTEPGSDRTTTFRPSTAASDSSRFRVLRPHAQGGLGAVFVALDEELHREVALKQILDHHADDPTSRTRFVLEAEITGGLEHPGIVPVYGLGSYRDGRPYYAMRFIRGESLKDAVAEFHADESLKNKPGRRSLALRRLLRRFVDVCNAIDYAHTRGVLHRDIKPANIIVGKHGETLVVDWGLAKVVGRQDAGSATDERSLMPSSASGSIETLPGSALGTPAYMSPEQATGDLDRLGPQSDVYSLGATLYCILTGKPPFEDKDVGAVLRAVQMGNFPKPRALDPSIDRALEAVCLKAMAVEPDARHAMPRLLADDIERWTADEPISAWREPLSRRVRRWGRRHRTAVAVGAAVVLAALFGTAVVLAVQTEANGVLKQANTALAVANAKETKANAELSHANIALAAAKDREAARFGLAMEAIKLFHGQVGDDLILKEAQFKPLRDKLLGGAADFYGKLEKLLQGQVDPSSRKAMGNAYIELGELTDTIGDKSAALAAYRKSLAVHRELAAQPDADSEVQAKVAQSLHAVAFLLGQTGKSAEALTHFDEARHLLVRLPPSGPDSNVRRRLLGLVHSGIARELAATGRPDAAMSDYQRSAEIMARLVNDNPDVTDFRNELASIYTSIGVLRYKIGKPDEARESYRQALIIQQKVVDDNPAVTRFQRILAQIHNNIGSLELQAGKTAESMEAYRRSLMIRQKLADDNPAVTEFRDGLALSHTNIGGVLYQTGRLTEALESYRRALAIQQKLADDNPAVPEFRNGLARSHQGISAMLSQTGRQVEALEACRRSLMIRQKLADDNPAVPEFRSDLAISHQNIASVLFQTGRPAEALEALRQALAIQQKLADDSPAVPEFRRVLASGHTDLAEVEDTLGRATEAREGYRRAIAICEELVLAEPEVTRYRSQLARSVRRLGLVRLAGGNSAGAFKDARKAAALFEGLPSLTNEECYELACCHAALIGAAGRDGSATSADNDEVEADKAMDLLRRAAGNGFRNIDTMTKEAALNTLRDRPDFRLLMMDVAMPAKPFAK